MRTIIINNAPLVAGTNRLADDLFLKDLALRLVRAWGTVATLYVIIIVALFFSYYNNSQSSTYMKSNIIYCGMGIFLSLSMLGASQSLRSGTRPTIKNINICILLSCIIGLYSLFLLIFLPYYNQANGASTIMFLLFIFLAIVNFTLLRVSYHILINMKAAVLLVESGSTIGANSTGYYSEDSESGSYIAPNVVPVAYASTSFNGRPEDLPVAYVTSPIRPVENR